MGFFHINNNDEYTTNPSHPNRLRRKPSTRQPSTHSVSSRRSSLAWEDLPPPPVSQLEYRSSPTSPTDSGSMSFRQGQGFQSASPPLPPPPGNDGGGYRSSPPTSQRQYQQQQHQHQQLQQQQHGSYGSTGSLTPPPHMQAQRRGSPLSQPQAGGSHPRDQFQPRGSADPQSFARNQAGQQAGQRPLSYMGQPTNHQQQLQQQQRNSPLERTGGHAYSQSVSQPGDRFNAPSRSGSTHSPGPSSTGGRDQQLSGGSIARRGSTASNATSSAAAPPKPPSTIAGEPLHDLGRAIALLKSSKFYAEGFLMKKTEVGPDGKAVSSRWRLRSAASTHD